MAVEQQHPQYVARSAQWKRARDAAAGEDAVHFAGEVYLPRLSEETNTEYKARKQRTGFYNATARTISGLVGMMFRKPPKLEVPANMDADLKDADMKGKPFVMFAEDVSDEVLTVNRVGVLVDYVPAPVTEAVLTEAIAADLGLRPKLVMYKTENIINWKTSRVKNIAVLSLVVLVEEYEYPVGQGPRDFPFDGVSTEFKSVCETRWRVLDLGGDNETYRQRIFRKDKRDGRDVLVETIVPLINNATLDFIPFVFISSDGIDVEAQAPPLIDLINVNMKHYLVTADYEHGCHFTGLPTPIIKNYQNPKPEKAAPSFYVGSTKFIVLQGQDTDAKYMEFTGQGLTALENNLDRKEQQMAILGARMLAAEKKTAETATTAAIHRTGENSILSGTSVSVSLALTKILGWFAMWKSIAVTDKNVLFEMTREFFPISIDAPTLTALILAWQKGAISFDTFYDMLQRGDISQNDITAAEEQQRIKNNPPPGPGEPGGPPLPVNKPGVGTPAA